MTLTRRMVLLMAGLLLLALGGALVIQTVGARQALMQQQDMRNRDAAAALALALSQHGGDPVALQTVAAAQFDQGHYRHIRLVAASGAVLVSLQQADPAPQVPAWFQRLLPLQVPPGEALVSDGWKELGRLQVEAHATWAQQVLWRATTQTAGLLAVLALAAALLAAALLRAWLRPLAAAVAQARALEAGRFEMAPLPALPELQQLTRTMNASVSRLRDVFARQAEQVAYLQRQAQLDALTGLPRRGQFVLALERRLAQPSGPGLGLSLGAGPGSGLSLLLLRVGGVAQLNERYGHVCADEVLRTMGQQLRQAALAEPDVLAARLTGTDFVLGFPVPGMAAERRAALLGRLQQAARPLLPAAEPPLALHLVTLEGATGADVPAVLARCSQALAQAEAGAGAGADDPAAQPYGVVTAVTAAQALAEAGQRLQAALHGRRAQLGEYEVQDASGGLVHLECPLRLQPDPAGGFEPAANWLAVARRCGLLPQVDAVAIGLALQACAHDGRPRAVNVSLDSLADATWAAGVSQDLRAAGAAAKLLSIEWADPLGDGDWQAAAPVIAAWRPLGVGMGVEHAGAAPEALPHLSNLGLSYVKVDAMHLRAAATDPAVAAYARSLVGLIQLMGLRAYAEGVDRPDDLATLWQLGFDGATGRAVRAGR